MKNQRIYALMQTLNYGETQCEKSAIRRCWIARNFFEIRKGGKNCQGEFFRLVSKSSSSAIQLKLACYGETRRTFEINRKTNSGFPREFLQFCNGLEH